MPHKLKKKLPVLPFAALAVAALPPPVAAQEGWRLTGANKLGWQQVARSGEITVKVMDGPYTREGIYATADIKLIDMKNYKCSPQSCKNKTPEQVARVKFNCNNREYTLVGQDIWEHNEDYGGVEIPYLFYRYEYNPTHSLFYSIDDKSRTALHDRICGDDAIRTQMAQQAADLAKLLQIAAAQINTPFSFGDDFTVTSARVIGNATLGLTVQYGGEGKVPAEWRRDLEGVFCVDMGKVLIAGSEFHFSYQRPDGDFLERSRVSADSCGFKSNPASVTELVRAIEAADTIPSAPKPTSSAPIVAPEATVQNQGIVAAMPSTAVVAPTTPSAASSTPAVARPPFDPVRPLAGLQPVVSSGVPEGWGTRPANNAPRAAVLERAEAIYPPRALRTETVGRVAVNVAISASGQAIGCFVDDRPGQDEEHWLLVYATCEAYLRHTYSAATVDGTPVASRFQGAINWQLDSGSAVQTATPPSAPARASPSAPATATPSPAPAASSFDNGLAAYERKDYATALRLWRPLAERGHTRAQYRLGVMYQYGYGVAQDYVKAVEWYRRSAEQGYDDAQNNLGLMYERGHGVTQDYAQARAWYRRAAAQGNSFARNNLSRLALDDYLFEEDW